jgi:phosphoenolpyruvate phosphomutase
LAAVGEFAGKIKAAREASSDDDFCVVARVEEFIAGWGLEEALTRAHAYADSGATAILIHSARRDASEVLAFQHAFERRLPVIVVPTKYHTTPTPVLRDAGFSVVIWANHLMRSALTAMQQTAARIYADQSLLAVEDQVAPLSEVFRLQGENELEDAERRYLPATTKKARAVVLAASRGKELGELTLERPKCMIPLGGRPLLQRIVDTYRSAGVREIAVVRGYKKDAVVVEGIECVDNDAHETTAEVGSLLCARASLEGSVIISYGDVLFQRHVIDSLCDVGDDIAIAVDPAWQLSRNRGARHADLVRCSRPFSRDSFLGQVTLTAVPSLRVEEVSVARNGEPAVDGEWIGVLKVSPAGATALLSLLDALCAEGVAVESLRIPDLLHQALQRGLSVRVLYTAGSWLDVDTAEDLCDFTRPLGA